MNSELSKPEERQSPQVPVYCVDSHFHVFRSGESRPGARYVPGYDAPLSAWQTAAKPLGVTHGVLVQTSFLGTDNRLLVDTLAQNPGTLRGVAVVPPWSQWADLVTLHEAGVRGIRLNLAGQTHDLQAWAKANPLWNALMQLGWHVELHTDPGQLAAVIQGLPQALPLVLDHFGRPQRASRHDDTVRAVGTRRQAPVMVKLSAAYRLLPGLMARELADLWLGELGPKALLWGSDWPCTNHETQADLPRLFDALDDWLAQDDALLTLTRSANPLRLYWGTGAPA
jgi:predicted TIM-barrel fold metal-dependent hydrolase